MFHQVFNDFKIPHVCRIMQWCKSVNRLGVYFSSFFHQVFDNIKVSFERSGKQGCLITVVVALIDIGAMLHQIFDDFEVTVARSSVQRREPCPAFVVDMRALTETLALSHSSE